MKQARPLMAKALEDGSYHEFVDPRLEDNFNPQEMARMVASAAASIRHSARRRPKMSQVYISYKYVKSVAIYDRKIYINIKITYVNTYTR